MDGFSVIMPTYNQAAFIRRAIHSLLKQSYSTWELIIVNDGCTDDTGFFISDFLTNPRITYIENESNMGLGHAINQGLKIAKYKYIAYLPSDDFYYENHLKSFMENFRKYPEAVLLFSGIRYRIVDIMVNSPDKESKGLKTGHPLQLVQVSHKKNEERWVERTEWVSEDLFEMFWKKIMDQGAFISTKLISCFWTNHPNQRHKITGERFGGGLNQYRAFYKVKTPIRMRTSKYKLIDEENLYKSFRKKVKIGSESLKILIVGELAYNPERIYALEQAGHKLYGLWVPRPEYTFNTVGPLPFGNITDLPFNNWQEKIHEIKPDIIYALLNHVAVNLAYDVLKANPMIPFVWHFKEGPSICLQRGLWEKLIYLYAYSDGKIYLNETVKQWFDLFIPQGGLEFLLDGDIPKKDSFLKRFSSKLSEIDGNIHTIVAGRVVGITQKDMRFLAFHNIHVHSYTENYHNARVGLNHSMKMAAPNHFHIHPHCSHQDWTEEFSKYDAGWLHCLKSENEENILDVSWDDLNMPARINTYAAAGLPVILKNNPGHIVATQSKIRQLEYGLFFDTLEDLVGQLKNKAHMTSLTQNAIKAQKLFTFDYYVDDLIAFFKNVIKNKKVENEKRNS